MAKLVEGAVVNAVESYTGRKVTQVEVIPDPQVPGCYACRAEFVQPSGAQSPVLPFEFMLRGVSLQKATDDDIEETEFRQWPPTQRHERGGPR